MIKKPIIISNILFISLLLLSGCSSSIEEMRIVRDKHNRDVEYIIEQEQVNQETIEQFKNEVIGYLKGNTTITSIDMSKIRQGERITEVLKEIKSEIEKEIEDRVEELQLDNEIQIGEEPLEIKVIDIEEIKEDYFNEIEYYTFQDLSTGELEFTMFYSTKNYTKGVFSINWIEQIGYNVKNRILR